MTVAPKEIDDREQLNRRIHPTFVKPDGTVSSQAFTDLKMSVDRAEYRKPKESLLNYNGYGLAGFITQMARKIGQEVYAEPELLNFAHAIVEGKKQNLLLDLLLRPLIGLCLFLLDTLNQVHLAFKLSPLCS